MRKYIIRFLAVLLIGEIAVNPVAASGLGSSGDSFPGKIPAISNRFHQEALSPPILNFAHALTSVTQKMWSWIGHLGDSARQPLRLMRPADGPLGTVFMAGLSESSSGARPRKSRHPDPHVADEWRQKINRHNGTNMIPVAAAFQRFGVIDLLRARESVTMDEILTHLHEQGKQGNRGFWEGNLQGLANQGWLTREMSPDGRTLRVHLTDLGRIMTGKGYVDAYVKAAGLIERDLGTVKKLEEFLVQTFPRGPPAGRKLTFPQAVALAARDWDLPVDPDHPEIWRRALENLNGLLVGITVITLDDRGVLDQLQKGPISIPEARSQLLRRLTRWERLQEKVWRFIAVIVWARGDDVDAAFELLGQQGYLVKNRDRLYVTGRGSMALPKVMAAGVPISYLPTFAQIDELLVGDPAKVFVRDRHGNELWVSRRINLLGTRAAHAAYFKKLTPWLKTLFDQPIEKQPQFLADMGCGEGSLSAEAYEFILKNTLRGQLIREDPEKYKLTIVAADYNPVARQMARETLDNVLIEVDDRHYTIPHEVVHGDINDPEGFTVTLENLGLNPFDGAHMSSVLIHNRPHRKTVGIPEPTALFPGIYISPDPQYAAEGYAIRANVVERNLFEWFLAWKPLIARHGMFTTELHALRDEMAADLVEEIAQSSYASTHVNTGQFLTTVPVHLEKARAAGLEVVNKILIPYDIDGHAPISLLHLRAAADEFSEAATQRVTQAHAKATHDAVPVPSLRISWQLKLLSRLYRLLLQPFVIMRGLDLMPPASDSFIMAGNHSALLDGLLIAADFFARDPYHRLPRFMAETRYLGPMMQHLILKLGAGIPMEKDGNILRVVERLRSEGEIAGIFPAGRPETNSELFLRYNRSDRGWKSGVALTAIRAGVPIVPFFVSSNLEPGWTVRDLLERWWYWARHGFAGQPFHFMVIFGSPIDSAGKTAEQLMAELKQAVLKLKKEYEIEKDTHRGPTAKDIQNPLPKEPKPFDPHVLRAA